jgi:nicotinate-nucleotide pyrophosphorylase (carboxylating)
VVYTALAEDLGDPPRDVTSEATIPAAQIDTAELVARRAGVVAGLPVAAQVFAATSGGTATFEQRVDEAPGGPRRRARRGHRPTRRC